MTSFQDVNLETIEVAIHEVGVTFSLFDIRTWFWGNFRRFKITFRIPAEERYEVADCYAIPQLEKHEHKFECVLLTTFKPSVKKIIKVNFFTVEFNCPQSLMELTFSLAVQVKHAVIVSL